MTSNELRAKAAAALLQVAQRIETCGHQQGMSETGGRYCMLGALDRATADPAVHLAAWQLLAQHLGLPLRISQLTAWKDTPGRTIEEVLMGLRTAAAL